MPVLHRGRVKPLDTYARSVVQIICGRENPQLSLDGAMPVANDQSGPTSGDRGPAEAAPLVLARALFPDGKAATFNSSELVFSWLVEPEKWERVPFLAAANEDLRRELDLPIMDSQGNHLKYASPWDVAHSDALRKRLEDFSMAQQHATKEEKTLEPTGVDKKAQDLWEAYWAFRTVSFHPETARGGRQRLREQISEFAKVWAEAGPGLERWRKTVRGSQDDKRSQGDKGSKDDPVDAIFAAVQELAKVADPGTPEWSVSLAELEPIVARLQHAAEQCAWRSTRPAAGWRRWRWRTRGLWASIGLASGSAARSPGRPTSQNWQGRRTMPSMTMPTPCTPILPQPTIRRGPIRSPWSRP